LPNPNDKPVAVLSAVSATYGAVRALDRVSATFARGEMCALIGPSGSGKSTLLRAMAGLTAIDPGEGEIAVFGETLQSGGRISPRARALRTRIGFIFQKFNLVGRLSLFTNVMIGRLGRVSLARGLLGLWAAKDRRLAMAALDRLGIADHAGQRALTLSGGQQQRGAIARALVQEAELILADEPVASLDPASARRVMDALARINREDGATVVVCLHQIDLATRYCPRIVALDRGKVVYDGPAEGLDPQRLKALYGAEYRDAALLEDDA
jgi:phosphonate transport system ATP-binding protein